MQNWDLRSTIQLYKGMDARGCKGWVSWQINVCVCVRACAYLTVFGIRRRVDMVSIPFMSRYEFWRHNFHMVLSVFAVNPNRMPRGCSCLAGKCSNAYDYILSIFNFPCERWARTNNLFLFFFCRCCYTSNSAWHKVQYCFWERASTLLWICIQTLFITTLTRARYRHLSWVTYSHYAPSTLNN